MKDMRSASAEESTRLSQRSLGRVLIERTAKVFECELRVREADGGIKPGVSTSEPGNAPQLIRWSPRGGRQPFIKSGVDTRDSFESWVTLASPLHRAPKTAPPEDFFSI